MDGAREHRPALARRGGASAGALVVALVVLGIGAGGPGASGAAPSARADAPILSLLLTPQAGSAPLWVNATVNVAGGAGPFNLSLCFGTVDHTSPPAGCGAGTAANWSGSAPLTFTHRYETPGNFSVVAVVSDASGAGSGATALVVVTAAGALAVSASPSTTSGRAPLTVEFSESLTGGSPPLTVQWRFGDGTSGSGEVNGAVAHTYESAGTYTPSVTVTDGAGHRSSRTLAPIVVAAAAPAAYGGLTSGAVVLYLPALALLAATGLLVAVVVRLRRNEALREEGEDLVDTLRLEREAARPGREGPL